MSKIDIIHPIDYTTDFLKPISIRILQYLEGTIFTPNASIIDHEKCLDAVKLSSSELVLFMGHGQSDKLFGAAVNNLNDIEYKLYKDKGFINSENIDVFQKIKVICLSCDSNKRIGKIAIGKETLTFVGFGNIPTDWITAVDEEIALQSFEVDFFNELLVQIFSDAIIYSIYNDFNFNQFERIFKIITNKEIFELINNGYESNSWLIHNLYNLKDEIKVFGEGSLKLID